MVRSRLSSRGSASACRGNFISCRAFTGGHLVVTTGVAVDQHLPGNDGRLLPAVVVTFRDDGPGISAVDLERLATPFFTTKPKGTGLGLAVARHWITQHGGTLDIDGLPGAGATVRVALPLDRKAVSAGPPVRVGVET